MSRILYICHRIPYPPNKGDKIRTYNILKYLTRHHQVTLACLIDERADIQHLPKLKEMVGDVLVDIIDTPLRKGLSLLKALLNQQSITVPFFYSKRLQKEIDQVITNKQFDVILCSSSPTAEYLFNSQHDMTALDAVKIMDLIDVDSQKWQQLARQRTGLLGWIFRREARQLSQYEQSIHQQFDHLFVVSQSELETFEKIVPGKKTEVLENGVDLEHFDPAYKPSARNLNHPNLVFTGSMDYSINIEAIDWFLQHIYPKVLKACPAITFYIVGRNPDPDHIRRWTQQGVVITGFVDDIRDYLQDADICIAPITVARGIKNKVLEAMAMGKTVIATPQAIEGLQLVPDQDIIVEKSANLFADAIIEYIQNENRRNAVGNQARLTIIKHYDWDSKLSILDRFISVQ